MARQIVKIGDLSSSDFSTTSNKLSIKNKVVINDETSNVAPALGASPTNAPSVVSRDLIVEEVYSDLIRYWYYDISTSSWVHKGDFSKSATSYLSNIVIVAASNSYGSGTADYICDGTDDHIQINSAIVDARTKGGVVKLLPGDYHISDSIVITDSDFGLTLYCEEKRGAKISASVPLTQNKPHIDFQSTISISDIVVDGLYIDALNKVNSTSTLTGGVIGSTINSGTFNNLTIINNFITTKGTFNTPFNISNFSTSGANWLISRNSFIINGTTTASNYGIHIGITVKNIIIVNNIIDLKNDGVNVMFNALALYADCNEFIISNNQITCTKGHSPLAVSTSHNGIVVGNYVRHDSPHTSEFGIEVENKVGHSSTGGVCENVTVTGNTVIIGSSSDNTTGGIVIRDFDGNTNVPKNIVLSSNVIVGAYKGVYIDGCDGYVISSNSFKNCTIDFDLNQNKTHIASDTAINNFKITPDSLRVLETGDWTSGKIAIKRDTANVSFEFASKIVVYDSGNVSIGKSGSHVELDVYGGKINTLESARSIRLGEQAGNALDTSSNRNCVLIGYRAGFNYSNGSDGIAIGNSALYSAVTGFGNIAIGGLSLQLTTSGAKNLGIGYQSLMSNTTGSSNIAIGYRANYLNSTGTANISIGDSTNKSQTSGNYITAIGHSCMSLNQSGQYTVALGGLALNAATSATSVTSIGYKSGQYEGGNNNVFIGTNTGKQASPIQTISGCVIIGYNAGQLNTVSDRLMIANSNTNSPLIDGDFSKSLLSINNILKLVGIPSDPPSGDLSDGMIWYNNTLNVFRKRENGVTLNL